MKLNTLLLVMALAEIVFGIGFLCAPAVMMNLFGVAGSSALFFVSRMFGAAILSLGILFWLSRQVANAAALHPVIIAGLVYNALAAILIFMAVSSGLINPSGWGTVVLHTLLTAGFGYFAFVKRA